VHRYFRICFKSVPIAAKTSAHAITERTSAASMSAGLHAPNGLLSAAAMAIIGNIKTFATIGDTCNPTNIPTNGATRPNTPPHINAFLLLFNIPKLYHRKALAYPHLLSSVDSRRKMSGAITWHETHHRTER